MTAVLTGPVKKLGLKCDWTVFDQIVLDLTDAGGPSLELYTPEFYQACAARLTPMGRPRRRRHQVAIHMRLIHRDIDELAARQQHHRRTPGRMPEQSDTIGVDVTGQGWFRQNIGQSDIEIPRAVPKVGDVHWTHTCLAERRRFTEVRNAHNNIAMSGQGFGNPGIVHRRAHRAVRQKNKGHALARNRRRAGDTAFADPVIVRRLGDTVGRKPDIEGNRPIVGVLDPRCLISSRVDHPRRLERGARCGHQRQHGKGKASLHGVSPRKRPGRSFPRHRTGRQAV